MLTPTLITLNGLEPHHLSVIQQCLLNNYSREDRAYLSDIIHEAEAIITTAISQKVVE
jgi:hypothetical protein